MSWFIGEQQGTAVRGQFYLSFGVEVQEPSGHATLPTGLTLALPCDPRPWEQKKITGIGRQNRANIPEKMPTGDLIGQLQVKWEIDEIVVIDCTPMKMNLRLKGKLIVDDQAYMIFGDRWED